MSNEIKLGDKVRVSKDAPRMYISGHCRFFYGVESVVEEIEDGNAIIRRDDGSVNKALAIPCKYLVKVDAEAKEANVKIGDRVIVHYPSGDRIGHIKEVMLDGTYDIDYGGGCTGHNITRSQIEPYTAPKFKVGDRVKFKNIYELQKVKDKSFRWMLLMFASKEATITAVEDNGFYRVDIDPSIGGINDDMIECKVEPTEHTEAEKKPNIGSIKIPVEVDLTDSYWDAYAADLAKEVVLKTVNSASDRRPMAIAEYATGVAKAVVEGLKGK